MADGVNHYEIERLGYAAARQKILDRLKSLIDLYRLHRNSNWCEVIDLLIAAVMERSKEIAKYLISAIAENLFRRVEPNSRFLEPLINAITTNMSEVVEPLLEGPPIESRNELHIKLFYPGDHRIPFRGSYHEDVLPIVHIARLLLEYPEEQSIEAALGKKTIKNGEKLVELLLESGADINWVDAQGKTALHEAIRGRQWNIVSLFLRYKRHIDCDAIAKYCTFEVLKECDQMIETFANFRQRVNLFKGDMDNSFFKAIREGNTQVLETLLRSDEFQLNVKRRVSPLHVAAFYRQKEVCQMLMNFGADLLATDGRSLDCRGFTGETPIDYAIRNRDSAMLTYFFSIHKVPDSALFTAVQYNLPDMVQLLLENGAYFFATNRCGLTPLHRTLFNENANCAKVLLEFGANPNARSRRDGSTILHCIPHAFETFHLLLQYSGDINISNSRGETPFTCHVHSQTTFASCVQQSLILLDAAELHISDLNRQFWQELREKDETINENAATLTGVCKTEVAAMKKEEIALGTSLYDILTASENKLARLTGNEAAMEKVLSGEYSEQFPYYNRMIMGKFKIGKVRREYLEKGCKSMQKMFPNLPVLCIEKIVHSFCIQDLWMLCKDND